MTIKQTTARITGESGMSRRASLLALGGTALAATLAQPRVADAKKRKKTCKKTRKKCDELCEQRKNQVCEQQGIQCRTRVTNVCTGTEDPAACQEFFFPLCEALGRCDAQPLLEQTVVLI